MNIGDFVTVVGRSQKGKNRIREHGNSWKVVKIQGVKILVEANNWKKYKRWIDGPDDCDFDVIKVF